MSVKSQQAQTQKLSPLLITQPQNLGHSHTSGSAVVVAGTKAVAMVLMELFWVSLTTTTLP